MYQISRKAGSLLFSDGLSTQLFTYESLIMNLNKKIKKIYHFFTCRLEFVKFSVDNQLSFKLNLPKVVGVEILIFHFLIKKSCLVWLIFMTCTCDRCSAPCDLYLLSLLLHLQTYAILSLHGLYFMAYKLILIWSMPDEFVHFLQNID